MLVGVFAPVKKDFMNGGAKIGQALVTCLPLAICLGKLCTDSGESCLSINRTVVNFNSKVHGLYFGSMRKIGKELKGGAKGARSGRFCPAVAGHADAWISKSGKRKAEGELGVRGLRFLGLLTQRTRRKRRKWESENVGAVKREGLSQGLKFFSGQA